MIGIISDSWNKLKRLWDDYTTARAVKLDNLDATVSSRMGSTAINSIQQGVLTWNDVTQKNVTITAVTLAKSMVIVSNYSESTLVATGFVRAQLTTTTNLELYIGITDAPNNISVAWKVVEFK